MNIPQFDPFGRAFSLDHNLPPGRNIALIPGNLAPQLAYMSNPASPTSVPPFPGATIGATLGPGRVASSNTLLRLRVPANCPTFNAGMGLIGIGQISDPNAILPGWVEPGSYAPVQNPLNPSFGATVNAVSVESYTANPAGGDVLCVLGIFRKQTGVPIVYPNIDLNGYFEQTPTGVVWYQSNILPQGTFCIVNRQTGVAAPIDTAPANIGQTMIGVSLGAGAVKIGSYTGPVRIAANNGIWPPGCLLGFNIPTVPGCATITLPIPGPITGQTLEGIDTTDAGTSVLVQAVIGKGANT